ncbi:hypothetical protein GGU11DRAFT_565860 [Lentinula aff. detonsa]|nr:hypothetical protein GGU11DRAFT_565860 [Lentinula aff. detonsa]
MTRHQLHTSKLHTQSSIYHFGLCYVRLLSTEPKCNMPKRYGLEMLKRSKIRLVSGTRPESFFSHIYSAKLFKRCPQKAPVHLATRICYVNLIHQYRSVADLVPTSISSISIVIAILTVAIVSGHAILTTNDRSSSVIILYYSSAPMKLDGAFGNAFTPLRAIAGTLEV